MEPLDLSSGQDYPLTPPPAHSGAGVRRGPQRRPSVLAQWAWGLWDMVLRLVEFSVKMVGAALIVLVLLIAGAIYGWHHVVEPGVEKLQDLSTTTTTAP
jgi:hypothetical protein